MQLLLEDNNFSLKILAFYHKLDIIDVQLYFFCTLTKQKIMTTSNEKAVSANKIPNSVSPSGMVFFQIKPFKDNDR
ncbi:MAG: hypothetical protein WCJ39_04125 [bacterium]